jgi:hypothetical protein
MENIGTFIIFGIVFIALMWVGFRLQYLRHFKSYIEEIKLHLEKRNLSFKTKRKPKRTDWIDSPFDEPPFIEINFITLRIGGIIMSAYDCKYYVIETSEGKSIWLKIETTFLKKPKLIFRDGLAPKPLRSNDEIGNQKTFQCPACNYTIIESDKACPDCGLALK